MSTVLETLQAEVLRLSLADRAKLLDRLIASLDVDIGIEADWDKLADEREQELAAGTANAVLLEVAIARLEARFPGSRSRCIPLPSRISTKPPLSTTARARPLWQPASLPSSNGSRRCCLSFRKSVRLGQRVGAVLRGASFRTPSSIASSAKKSRSSSSSTTASALGLVGGVHSRCRRPPANLAPTSTRMLHRDGFQTRASASRRRETLRCLAMPMMPSPQTSSAHDEASGTGETSTFTNGTIRA